MTVQKPPELRFLGIPLRAFFWLPRLLRARIHRWAHVRGVKRQIADVWKEFEREAEQLPPGDWEAQHDLYEHYDRHQLRRLEFLLHWHRTMPLVSRVYDLGLEPPELWEDVDDGGMKRPAPLALAKIRRELRDARWQRVERFATLAAIIVAVLAPATTRFIDTRAARCGLARLIQTEVQGNYAVALFSTMQGRSLTDPLRRSIFDATLTQHGTFPEALVNQLHVVYYDVNRVDEARGRGDVGEVYRQLVNLKTEIDGQHLIDTLKSEAATCWWLGQ